jgi:HlyD family secretion protein
MKSLINKAYLYFKARKGLAIAVAIVIIGAGYYGFGHVFAKTSSTSYVLGTAERGTLISTVSASGQVSASDQVDLKPDASGKITSVNVTEGQQVKEGDIIAQIDPTDAAQAVRDAQLSLESAQLSYDKVANPDSTSVLVAQNALSSAEQSKEDAASDLQKAYDNGYSGIGSIVQDLNDASNEVESILYDTSHSPYMAENDLRVSAGQGAIDDKQEAGMKYDSVKESIQDLTRAYNATTRATADETAIANFADEAYSASQELADAIKALSTTLDHIKADENTVPAQLSTDETSLASFQTKINGDVTSALSLKSAITDAKQSIQNADASIAEKQSSYNDTAVPSDIDLKTAELDVSQKREALESAEEKLADYTIRAPFDGVVATLDVKKGDTVSSDAIATLVTKEQIATVSLNEVDVAKIKVGDKATLSFDAVPDLSLTGEIVSIDTLGTVSQGVVSYDVKIGFDTQDSRVLSGMSVSANIITDSKPDVLLVPSSAVKTVGGQSVVQILPGASATGAATQSGITSSQEPQNVPVVIGDSNDTQTEITSGLSEGQAIIVRTVTSTTASKPAAATGAGAARAGAGGAAFFGGGGGNVQFRTGGTLKGG